MGWYLRISLSICCRKAVVSWLSWWFSSWLLSMTYYEDYSSTQNDKCATDMVKAKEFYVDALGLNMTKERRGTMNEKL